MGDDGGDLGGADLAQSILVQKAAGDEDATVGCG